MLAIDEHPREIGSVGLPPGVGIRVKPGCHGFAGLPIDHLDNLRSLIEELPGWLDLVPTVNWRFEHVITHVRLSLMCVPGRGLGNLRSRG